MNCEISQNLSHPENEAIQSREVDQNLEEIAWSKDRALNFEELEKIAMVMISIRTPYQSLHYKRHVLYDFLVKERTLEEILDQNESSSGFKYGKNVNPKTFAKACAARAVEINGLEIKLPLSPYFSQRP